MKRSSDSFKLIFGVLLSIFLFSCGGGGSEETGKVTLLVTDGPSENFSAINLHITRAELMSDNGRITLFEGDKVFDLLQLATVTEIFSVSNVPVGSYHKIRLTLRQIELVKLDGSTAYPKLPGNGKLDLNPRGSFTITAVTPLMIQLDFDAEKSIHIVTAGNSQKYQFRPVVFVKIINEAIDTKLVRLNGRVNKLNTANGSFELCNIKAQQLTLLDDNLPMCVLINTVAKGSSFFDSVGDPSDISDLTNEDTVTAVGRFDFSESVVTLVPTITSLPIGFGIEDDANNIDMTLIAEVIWSGDYAQVTGFSASTVLVDPISGDKYFDYDVIPGQDYQQGGSVANILASGSKIFSRQGQPLSEADIQIGVAATVDGVLQYSAENIAASLKAALLILDTDIPQTQLTGINSTIISAQSTLMLQTDTGDRCIKLDNNSTDIFQFVMDNNILSFNEETVLALQSNQQADVYGTEANGCLNASIIITE